MDCECDVESDRADVVPLLPKTTGTEYCTLGGGSVTTAASSQYVGSVSSTSTGRRCGAGIAGGRRTFAGAESSSVRLLVLDGNVGAALLPSELVVLYDELTSVPGVARWARGTTVLYVGSLPGGHPARGEYTGLLTAGPREDASTGASAYVGSCAESAMYASLAMADLPPPPPIATP